MLATSSLTEPESMVPEHPHRHRFEQRPNGPWVCAPSPRSIVNEHFTSPQRRLVQSLQHVCRGVNSVVRMARGLYSLPHNNAQAFVCEATTTGNHCVVRIIKTGDVVGCQRGVCRFMAHHVAAAGMRSIKTCPSQARPSFGRPALNGSRAPSAYTLVYRRASSACLMHWAQRGLRLAGCPDHRNRRFEDRVHPVSNASILLWSL